MANSSQTLSEEKIEATVAREVQEALGFFDAAYPKLMELTAPPGDTENYMNEDEL
ncbi:MAG: hypothetical protein ACM3UU_02005 [Ignavibacteriales bacterium]